MGFEAARPDWLVARRRAARGIGPPGAGDRDDRAVALLRGGRAGSTAWSTANTCRSVDAAAAQLIAREAGAFVSVLGYGGVEAPLDLDARYRLVAARTRRAWTPSRGR